MKQQYDKCRCGGTCQEENFNRQSHSTDKCCCPALQGWIVVIDNPRTTLQYTLSNCAEVGPENFTGLGDIWIGGHCPIFNHIFILTYIRIVLKSTNNSVFYLNINMHA